MQDGLEISNAFTIIVVSKLCHAELLSKFAEPEFGIISSKTLLKYFIVVTFIQMITNTRARTCAKLLSQFAEPGWSHDRFRDSA